MLNFYFQSVQHMSKTDITPAVIISRMTVGTIQKIFDHGRSIERVATRIYEIINEEKIPELHPIGNQPIGVKNVHELAFCVNQENTKIVDILFNSDIREPQGWDFGDYCLIAQKRYGVQNEMYLYKVITRLKSNTWVDVPVHAGIKEVIHQEMADVVSCICCGISETEVLKFRTIDVKHKR